MKFYVKKENQEVAIVFLNPKKYSVDEMLVKDEVEGNVVVRKLKKYSESMAFKKIEEQGFKYKQCDGKFDKSEIESRAQIYWEDLPNGDFEVKKDLTWDVKIMPDEIIKKKLLKKLQKSLDEELAKNDGDAFSALRLHREIEKLKSIKATNQNENPFWIEKAIEGLDTKVANGESDKSKIRKILKDKIKQLKKTKGE